MLMPMLFTWHLIGHMVSLDCDDSHWTHMRFSLDMVSLLVVMMVSLVVVMMVSLVVVIVMVLI